MRTKNVNALSESLSVIGLGCWAIGGSRVWTDSDDARSEATIRRAIELGVNLFDVAPVYGFGHAESLLGTVLRDTGQRKNVLIATKCGLVWDDAQRITRDLTPRSIGREIDASLQRLRTDYVDIYQLHWPDPNVPLQETLDELQRLRQAGKIRYIGLTNYSRPQTLEALKLAPIVSCQGLYNMLERNPQSYHSIPLEYRTQDEILPLCEQHGLAFFPYSPLFQGLLTGAFNRRTTFNRGDVRSQNPKLNGEQFQRRVAAADELKQLAAECGRPLGHLALSWLIEKGAVTSVICGAQTVDHIEQNAAAAQWDPGEEVLTRAERILQRHAVID
ncbi:MAG: aldo/keto reductase [Spirochaetaceae bacterium]|nr:MAG: aldo/keto reductase [Spirochaetaceae bacterium]